MKKAIIPDGAKVQDPMTQRLMDKIKIMGTTTVGPKGQILIPKSVRELADIKSGDNLMMIIKHDRLIGLVKMDDISVFMEMMD